MFTLIVIFYIIIVPSLVTSQQTPCNTQDMYFISPSGTRCIKCYCGMYLTEYCTKPNSTSVCAMCERGRFNPDMSRATQCLNCKSTCETKELVVVSPCSATSDLKCDCPEGTYNEFVHLDMLHAKCNWHSLCGPGKELKEKGTTQTDTTCVNCVDGETFSGNHSLQKCQSCNTKCDNVISPCNVTHDTVCAWHGNNSVSSSPAPTATANSTHTTNQHNGKPPTILLYLVGVVVPIVVIIILCCAYIIWKGHRARASLADADTTKNPSDLNRDTISASIELDNITSESSRNNGNIFINTNDNTSRGDIDGNHSASTVALKNRSAERHDNEASDESDIASTMHADMATHSETSIEQTQHTNDWDSIWIRTSWYLSKHIKSSECKQLLRDMSVESAYSQVNNLDTMLDHIHQNNIQQGIREVLYHQLIYINTCFKNPQDTLKKTLVDILSRDNNQLLEQLRGKETYFKDHQENNQ